MAEAAPSAGAERAEPEGPWRGPDLEAAVGSRRRTRARVARELDSGEPAPGSHRRGAEVVAAVERKGGPRAVGAWEARVPSTVWAAGGAKRRGTCGVLRCSAPPRPGLAPRFPGRSGAAWPHFWLRPDSTCLAGEAVESLGRMSERGPLGGEGEPTSSKLGQPWQIREVEELTPNRPLTRHTWLGHWSKRTPKVLRRAPQAPRRP